MNRLKFIGVGSGIICCPAHRKAMQRRSPDIALRPTQPSPRRCINTGCFLHICATHNGAYTQLPARAYTLGQAAAMSKSRWSTYLLPRPNPVPDRPTHISYEPLPVAHGNTKNSHQPSCDTKLLSRSHHFPQSSRRRFSGWRGGVVASIVVTASVLLNIVLAIIAATVWDPKDGIATVWTGNCKIASRGATVTHLLINLLSTLLLGASNYCMQRLVAPTRQEIDIAHAQKKWLDICIPSVRNISSINSKRMLLWLLLGLSSVPLHLM